MNTEKTLAAKRILVVGATGAVGGAIARRCAEAGANLVLTGRNTTRLQQITADTGGVSQVLDLSSADSIGGWSVDAEALDAVVYAAGIAPLAPIKYLQAQQLVDCLQVNSVAPLLLVRELHKQKKLKKGASIVFLSSLAASSGAAGYASYAASKGALEAAARCLAIEFAPQQIRVNCIAPGMLDSEMAHEAGERISQEALESHTKDYPLGIGTPQDVAQAAAYLISDASRWMTGVVLPLDGGFLAK
jgi:NAD(P)-dependent dehydrogenase (short-subunit alcohol dehydrogenase family)